MSEVVEEDWRHAATGSERVLGALTKISSTIAALTSDSIKQSWEGNPNHACGMYDFCVLTPEEDPLLERRLSWIVHLLRMRGFTVWRSHFEFGCDVSARSTLFVMPKIEEAEAKAEEKEEEKEEKEDEEEAPLQEDEDEDAEKEKEPEEMSEQAQTLLAAVQVLGKMDQSQSQSLVALYQSVDLGADDPLERILSIISDTGASRMVETIRKNLVGALPISTAMDRTQCGEIITEVVRLSNLTIPSGLFDLAGRRFMSFEQGSREWVVREVEKWGKNEASALCVVLAERGGGKSTLASELCRRSVRKEIELNVVGSFFFGEQTGSFRVHDCLHRLSEQLSTFFGDAFKRGSVAANQPTSLDMTKVFEWLIVRPLQQVEVEKGATFVCIIDGVDGIEDPEQKLFFGLIVDFFRHRDNRRRHLPKWFRLIITGEKETPGFLRDCAIETGTGTGTGRDPGVYVINVESAGTENQMDVARAVRNRVYLQRLSHGKENPLEFEAEVAQQVLSSSIGVFFYADIMARVAPTALGLRPQDILEQCLMATQTALKDTLYDNLFEVLVAAREAVPVDVIAQGSGMTEESVVDAVLALPVPIVDVDFSENEPPRVWLRHRLYKEWLLRKDVKLELAELQVDPQVGHQKLAGWCRDHPNTEFAQRHLLVHLACNTHDLDEAVTRFMDIDFLLSNVEKLSLEHLITDGETLLSQLHLSDRPLETIESVRVLINALRLTSNALQSSSSQEFLQLPSQLLGRIKDENHPIVRQCRAFAPLRPWLRPIAQSLTFADKALINSVYYGSDILRGVHLDRGGHLAITSHVNGADLRLWNVVDGSFIGRMAFETTVTASCMRGDGGGVVVGLDDGRMVIADVVSRRQVMEVQAHSGFITAVDVLNDGSYALSCSVDGSIKLWQLNASTRTATLVASHTFEPWELTVTCAVLEKGMEHGDGYSGKIVVGFKENRCLVFDAKLSKTLATLEGHRSAVTHLAYDPRLIASASFDRTCRIWDLTSGKCVHECKGHTACVTSVRFISEGTELLSVSLDKSMRLWSTLTGDCVRVVFHHTWAVLALDVSFHFLHREGLVSVLTATEDGYVQLWEVPELVSESKGTGKSLGGKSMISRMSLNSVTSLKGINRSIKSMKIKHIKSGLLKMMTSTYRDHHTLALDNASAQHTHQQIITAWAFSGDGRLASGSRDGRICLWEIESAALLASFHAHDQPISSLAFSPDGHCLLSASQDGSIKIFDLDKKQAFVQLQMPGEYSIDARFSKSGRKVVAQNLSRNLVIWDTRTYKRIPWDPHTRYKVFKPSMPSSSQALLEGVIGFTPDSSKIATTQIFPEMSICVIIERHKMHFLKIVPVKST